MASENSSLNCARSGYAGLIFGWFKVHPEFFQRFAIEQNETFKIERAREERYDAAFNAIVEGITAENGLEATTIHTDEYWAKRRDKVGSATTSENWGEEWTAEGHVDTAPTATSSATRDLDPPATSDPAAATQMN